MKGADFMANKTQVKGIVKVFAPTNKEAKQIIKTLNKIQQNWDYWTKYDVKSAEEKANHIEVPFKAIGRWGYSENINFFSKYIQGDINNSRAKDDGVSRSEAKFLKKTEWNLVYEFYDWDIHNKTLCRQKAHIDHSISLPINESFNGVSRRDLIEPTYYECCRSFGLTFEDLMDLGVIDYKPEQINEDAANQIIELIKKTAKDKKIMKKDVIKMLFPRENVKDYYRSTRKLLKAKHMTEES